MRYRVGTVTHGHPEPLDTGELGHEPTDLPTLAIVLCVASGLFGVLGGATEAWPGPFTGAVGIAIDGPSPYTLGLGGIAIGVGIVFLGIMIADSLGAPSGSEAWSLSLASPA